MLCRRSVKNSVTEALSFQKSLEAIYGHADELGLHHSSYCTREEFSRGHSVVSVVSCLARDIDGGVAVFLLVHFETILTSHHKQTIESIPVLNLLFFS